MTTENEGCSAETGRRLREVRGELSQAAFADKAGVHKNTLGGYERGERSPDAEFLRALVMLGYNVNWVLTGEGPERIGADSLESDGETPQARYQRRISKPLDEKLLQEVLAAVGSCEAEQGVTLTTRARSKVITILYKNCVANDRPLDRRTVMEMVELAVDIK